MRGGDARSGSLFSYVDLEARVPEFHPLRAIRALVNEALATLEKEFSALYSPLGRPSIPQDAAAGDAASSLLFDPLGAPADGSA